MRSKFHKPQRLLGEGLLFSAHAHPEKEAVRTENKSYTYGMLLDSVLRLASALHSFGLVKGDRVAIYMNNTWSCIVSIYAVTFAGGVFFIVNPQTNAEKLRFVLENSGARFLIADGFLAPMFIPVVHDSLFIEHVIFTDELKIQPANKKNYSNFDDIINDHAPSKQSTSVIPNDLAALIYTSGSTGDPKGVMQTHQAMVFTIWSIIEYLRLTISDRILSVLPLSFDYGLYQLLISVTLGATLFVERSFAFPAKVYTRIKEEHITVFPGVPTIFAMIIASSRNRGICFPSIVRVTSTAATLPISFIPKLKEIFPNALIYKMYGQTECKRISYLEPELVDIKPASVGKAIPGTEIFLLTPEGKTVDQGKSGILHVRGPHVMVGYWENPQLSSHVLKRGFIPGERILCTHDWFHMDDEGFLYFEGRSDDIINIGGKKVNPLEVENVLYAIPEIEEAAVIGVADEIMGESITAFIVLAKDCVLTGNKIRKTCLSKMENFMVPKTFIFLNKLPETQNGKIDRKELIKMT